ncbi:MAG: hypothetical protein ABW208_07250 [Pyrinomonadaceae bacterium]
MTSRKRRERKRKHAPTNHHTSASLGELHRQLTIEALGDNGSADSFVMLMMAVEDALEAGQVTAAKTILFGITLDAYRNNPIFVNDFMNYRERLERHLRRLKREAEGEKGGAQ